MAAETDFWGEISVVGDRTPLSILREQAALLGTKTQNLVEAQVETRGVSRALQHSFNLVVPVLDHYTYELFSIWHNVIDLYPIALNDEALFSGQDQFLLKDENALKEWLARKLSSPETKKILGHLLAQARS